LFGPDHYLPFIAMGRARSWSRRKTLLITFLCGLGHVASSVVLGLIGLWFGIRVLKLEAFESARGSLAAWLLIGFGLAYFVWGLHHALKNRPHSHTHSHAHIMHAHKHAHTQGHKHLHTPDESKNITPWILFIIFVFGPCEPLIPLLMYPAAAGSMTLVALVALVFSAATIATMLSVVYVTTLGVEKLRFGFIENYSHALAGLTLLACGGAIQFLGL